MNIDHTAQHPAIANIGTEKAKIDLSTAHRTDSSSDSTEVHRSGRFDQFVHENQSKSDSTGIYAVPKTENSNTQIPIDEEKNDGAKTDSGPKRIGTMGMLEKNCRREGPNGTCNHKDDTPGAYTEKPIYG